jgi:molecular chaperone DnaK
MPHPIGIDLGTTNSVISVYRRGRTETLRVDGKSSMPSVVCFRDKRSILVGVKALGMAMIRPERTILSIKRQMGDRNASHVIDGKNYTPVDISAMILKKLCEGHEDELGSAPRDAVITVPAYFTDAQRRDTKLAGEKAGLNVLRLLPEPTAAAIAIGLDKGRDQTILVYDLGGGTFDVSILRVQNNNFTVLAVNGNSDLGGNDFDAKLRDHALDIFKKQSNIDLQKESAEDSNVRQAMQMLASACERVKMELSEAEEAFLDLPNFFRGTHLETSITRLTFEGLIKDLVFETKDLVLKTIGEAENENGQPMGVDDIDRLVLVGGSTKIPLVSRVLADTIKEPYVADNVDLVVSAGASIMAANLYAVKEGGNVDYAPVEVNVTDVVPHPILNELRDMNSGTMCYPVILPKNDPLPSSGQMFSSAMDPQSGVVIGQLFRGDNHSPSDNEFLCKLEVTFSPTSSEVLFLDTVTLDENGVLCFESAIVEICVANGSVLSGLSPRQLYDRLQRNPNEVKIIKTLQTSMKL